MHLDKIALVLEGGGMRGVFSAGVFEALNAQGTDLSLYYRCFRRSL